MARRDTIWISLSLMLLLAASLCQAKSEPFFMAGAYAPPQPSWSPDAKRLAFTAATKQGLAVHTVGVGGGRSRFLAAGSCPSWSPRGDKIALVDSYGLVVVAAQGGKARKLADGPIWTDDSNLAWSPEGRLLAYQRWNRWQRPSPQYGDWASCGEVCVVDVRSGGVRQLTRVKAAFPRGRVPAEYWK